MLGLRMTASLIKMTLGMVGFATLGSAAEIDVDQRHPNDKKQYRTLELKNQLKVFLISDPTYNKSAAALDVRVGSLEDPFETLGMAHYLEHVLFLGTKTFPEPDAFVHYLEANQGRWNAYTANESTNYHFDVNHDAFEGALHQFSLFFIEPTFDKTFFDKERNAVHSEYRKNIDNDQRRRWRTAQLLMNQKHPASKFTVGTNETLAKATPAEMKAFYEKYYSANIMNLVLMSKRPLDEMEKLAKKYFGSIRNNKIKAPKYSPDIYDPGRLPAQLNVKSLKDEKLLYLSFPLPSLKPFWKSKPDALLGFLFGHEGKGSLLSLLKKENLASGLSAWAYGRDFAASFSAEITLTNHGQKNLDKVVSHFFSYLALVKKKGYPKYLYDERKAVRALGHVYREQREGVSVASHYASLMHDFPPETMQKDSTLLYEHSEKEFFNLIYRMSPDNLILTYSAKDAPANKKEHFYQTEYSIEKISPKRIKAWRAAKPHPELNYPGPNTFISKSPKVLSFKKSKPREILADKKAGKWGEFWYEPDVDFQLPKGALRLNIITPATGGSPQATMMALMYGQAIARSLQEWKYPIILAGLNFDIRTSVHGVEIFISGYSEHITSLLTTIAGKLQNITIDEVAFANVKEELKRGVRNNYKAAAYKQALTEKSYLQSALSFHAKDYYEDRKGEKHIDLISPVTLTQVKAYAKSLFKTIALEGAAFGNLKIDAVGDAVVRVPEILGSTVLPEEKRIRDKMLVPDKAKPVASRLTATINNNAWVAEFSFGERTPELHAALDIGHSFLKPSFFKELRTKQQLGYIVGSYVGMSDTQAGMGFVIQSDGYGPGELAKRARKWMKEMIPALEKMPKKEFESYRSAVAIKHRKKLKTMIEKRSRLYVEAIRLKRAFGYNEKVAVAAESLDQKEFIKIFSEAFAPKSERSISVYLAKPGDEKFKIAEKLIDDDRAFKSKAVYR